MDIQTETIKLTRYSTCAGCAAKVSASVLEDVLKGLKPVSDPRLVVAGGDDAAVIELPDGTLLVQTLDFFTPIVDDPYQFGQIAAANALSDVYAMGGRPLTAMNIVCFPTKTLGAEVLGRILLGGSDKVAAAGCLLVGGHSVEDVEPKYGLSVTGLVERGHLLTRRGAHPGQRLYLTKALGTGIVTTAHKRGKARDSDLTAAVASMSRLNEEARDLAIAHHATCATDVTGFGLLGHAMYMALDSGVTISISARRLPLLPGLQEYLAQDCWAGGSAANMAHFGPRVDWHPDTPEWLRKVAADAQTSGGLLFATDEDVSGAVEIGRVETAGTHPLRVEPNPPGHPERRSADVPGSAQGMVFPHDVLLEAVRDACREYRTLAIRPEEPEGWILHEAQSHLEGIFAVSLRRVVNATGVILHTNLGRAPLSQAAQRAVAEASGFCNVELDLATGRRGHRGAHTDALLRRLTGAEASLVVNNCAAAMMLMLDALGRGREVVVSRGELVEIGGSFRLPDVLRCSGATLREVGTTNKTSVQDYEAVIGASTGLLLKSHRSNFRIAGFTHEASCGELVTLGSRFGIPVVMDLGSGLLLDLKPFGIDDEPTVEDILLSGVGLVCFSGDKLLGGPQAGVIVGRAALVERCQNHPLMRALRVDKLTLAALEATLRAYLEPGQVLTSVPTLRMLTMSKETLRQEAEGLASDLRTVLGDSAEVAVEEGVSEMGGGTLPGRDLPTCGVAVRPHRGPESEWEARLRAGQPAVVCRVQRGALWLDPRTMGEGDRDQVVTAFRRVVGS